MNDLPPGFVLDPVVPPNPARNRGEEGMARQVAMTDEDQRFGEDNPALDRQLEREIARTKDPKAKAILLQEQQNRQGVALPQGFVLDTQAAPQPQQEGKPQPKGFWAALTAPGFNEETTIAAIGNRLHDVKSATAQFNRDGEWDAERKRRISMGESLSGMENWKLQRINEIIKEGKPEAPKPAFGEIVGAVLDQLGTDPGGLAGSLVRGIGTAPELMFLPEALPLRMAEVVAKAGKAAQVTARVGAEAAQVGGLAGAESALRQRTETGTVNPSQTFADTMMVAAPIVLLKSGFAALQRSGKAVPKAEIEADAAAAIKDGADPTAAALDALQKYGLEAEDAVKIRDAVKLTEVEDAAAKGQEPQGGERQHTGTEGERAPAETGGGDRAVGGGEVPQEEKAVTPPAEEKVAPPAEEKAAPSAQEEKAAPQPAPETPAMDAVDEVNRIMEKSRAGPPGDVLDTGTTGHAPPSQSRKVNIGNKGQRSIEFPTAEDAEVFDFAAKVNQRSNPRLADSQRLSLSKAIESWLPRMEKILGVTGRNAVMDAAKAYRQRLIDTAKVMPEDSSFRALGRNESGKIDPKLLAALGLAGIGGSVGYLFNKDPVEAFAGAVGAVAAGALLMKMGQGAVAVAGHLKDRRYRITHLTDEHSGDIQAGRLANYRFAEAGKQLVKDPKEREALTHALQGNTNIALTPRMQGAYLALQKFFEDMGKKGQAAGILPDKLLDDYVTQLWTGLNKNDSIFRNMVNALGNRNMGSGPGMAPRTRFAMKRVIPSYADGMARGLIPTTLDAFEIARIYGDNINKAIANKNLLSALERENTPWGERLMVRDTPDALSKQISRAAAIIDKQLSGGGAIGADIRKFAISKAPKDYVTIEHPQMRGYKVHRDIAPVMRNLFDAPPNAVSRMAYAASVAAKRGLFSYSLFHVKSLSDALLGTGMKAWGKVLNGDASQMLRRGQAGDALHDLVRGGLNVVERPLEGHVTPFTNALKLFEERHPVVGVPVKGMRLLGQAMDSFLWGTVHPTFKTATALAAYEKLLMDKPNAPKAELAKMAASFTNDIFGGVDWFRMADGVQNKFGRDLALAITSPRGRMFMQTLMLAPDWTVATTRAMVKAIPGISPRELAALHQGYVLRSALLYATVAEALNWHFSGHHFWQNEDPTTVDLGDGRRLQLSKHFMEPIHWVTQPAQQAWNKLGYVIKEPILQMANKEFLSMKEGKFGGPPMDSRIGHALRGVSPITGQQAFASGATPALTGFFGFPILGKTAEQSIEASKERAQTAGKDANKAVERETKRQQKLKEKREAINAP